MHGLLSKLAGIDSSAERGLRVIEFFDQLTMHHADIEAVTRAAAVLAQATAGVVLDDLGEIYAITASGALLDHAGPGAGALVSEIVVDDQSVGRAWLDLRALDEKPAAPRPNLELEPLPLHERSHVDRAVLREPWRVFVGVGTRHAEGSSAVRRSVRTSLRSSLDDAFLGSANLARLTLSRAVGTVWP